MLYGTRASTTIPQADKSSTSIMGVYEYLLFLYGPENRVKGAKLIKVLNDRFQ